MSLLDVFNLLLIEVDIKCEFLYSNAMLKLKTFLA